MHCSSFPLFFILPLMLKLIKFIQWRSHSAQQISSMKYLVTYINMSFSTLVGDVICFVVTYCLYEVSFSVVARTFQSRQEQKCVLTDLFIFLMQGMYTCSTTVYQKNNDYLFEDLGKFTSNIFSSFILAWKPPDSEYPCFICLGRCICPSLLFKQISICRCPRQCSHTDLSKYGAGLIESPYRGVLLMQPLK